MPSYHDGFFIPSQTVSQNASLVNSNLASLQNQSVDLNIHMEKQETQQCCKNTARGLTLPNLADLKDVFYHLLHVSLCVGMHFQDPQKPQEGFGVSGTGVTGS